MPEQRPADESPPPGGKERAQTPLTGVPKAYRTMFFVSLWIAISTTMIMFNKWMMASAGFPYPMALTTWHMLLGTLLTQSLRLCAPNMFPSLQTLDLSASKYMTTVFPIGFFFTLSLIFCNTAYIYLSVAFIQMIKAATPVLVLLLSFAMQLERPSLPLVQIILTISLGVGIASYGEVRFVLAGFVVQLLGTGSEAIRLTLVNVLLSSKGLKLDPLTFLLLTAPLCAVLNGTACFLFEYDTIAPGAFEGVGAGMFLANGIVAFSLNLSVVFLVKNASALVLTLAGIIKDILIISVSAVLFQSPVSSVQAGGYSIAVLGLQMYKEFKKKPENFRQGVSQGMAAAWCGGAPAAPAGAAAPVPLDEILAQDGPEAQTERLLGSGGESE